MENKLVKVNLHSQALKFGRKPDPAQGSLVEGLTDEAVREQVKAEQIQVVGFDLSYSEDRALFAVQKLLDATGYRGNAPSHKVGTSAYYLSSVPTLRAKKVDYLRAYGLEPLRSSRGKLEFSAGGRKAALEALLNLAERQFLIIYEKRVRSKSNQPVRIERVAPLIEVPIVDDRCLYIIPNPILVDQLDGYGGGNRKDSGYFMWLPQNLHTQVGGKDVAAVRFIEFLLYQVTRQWREEEPEVRFEMETLAYWLRLDHLIKGRKQGELRERLNRYYELAVRIGYLERYAVDQSGARSEKIDILTPNREFIRELISGRSS